jgi:hypothetical protein
MSDVTALQTLVAAEQAAVFGLSAAGGRLDDLAGGSAPAAQVATAYDVHRLRRDGWIAALRQLRGAVPVPAPAYALPAMPTAGAATTAAADLELRCGEAYRVALAGLPSGVVRAQVIAALIDSARRRYALLTAVGAAAGLAAVAFPGQD